MPTPYQVLLSTLSDHRVEPEGPVETLHRLIAERDQARADAREFAERLTALLTSHWTREFAKRLTTLLNSRWTDQVQLARALAYPISEPPHD